MRRATPAAQTSISTPYGAKLPEQIRASAERAHECRRFTRVRDSMLPAIVRFGAIASIAPSRLSTTEMLVIRLVVSTGGVAAGW